MTDGTRLLVSIIMGVYRCGDIDRLMMSVDSIISQTYRDWELIIVDDGSDDNGATLSAIEEVSRLDNRIMPLHYDDNHGLAYALNYGLSRARGELIARQDDDDYSDPNRLETQIAYLLDHPDCSILGTSARLFDDDGEWGYIETKVRPSKRDFLWNSPFIHPSVVMRSNALRSVGGYRVSKETMLGQDYDLFMRMYAAGYTGSNLSLPLYNYRSERNTLKYRSMSKRFLEAKVRAKGFRALGFGPSSWPYIAKPILLGMTPRCLYKRVQHQRYND